MSDCKYFQTTVVQINGWTAYLRVLLSRPQLNVSETFMRMPDHCLEKLEDVEEQAGTDLHWAR
jgi:hypothetical protein